MPKPTDSIVSPLVDLIETASKILIGEATEQNASILLALNHMHDRVELTIQS
jgi:hypothetical protein